MTVCWRAILSLAFNIFFLAVVTFLSASIGWTRGWVFLLVFLFQMAATVLYLWRTNPAVFIARAKIQQGTKPWDRVILRFFLLSFLAIFPIAGLDSHFGWSFVPTWLVVVGYVLFLAGCAISTWVKSINRFAERSVRIQSDRGHKVVDTGPYTIVRHPFYVAIFFSLGGAALALGSLWALLPAAIAAVIIVVRTAWEDRTLQNELEGYRQYAKRIRYRLVPGVW
jgi:protein-S-isoprenylcysteine O-methyltransferase Ste14